MSSQVDIIRKKRFGEELTRDELNAFAKGASDGSFADYQLSAMLMAICISGMSERETRDLTIAMAESGQMLNLDDIGPVITDKHSTGGVGDTTSLILVPLVAACGGKVAKLSGRGLGFTGGTLDKLESIPGVSTAMDIDAFKRAVGEIGCMIISQTAALAPADKTLYALRDVTGTVDCAPLIVSSILSKKIASGANRIVLDVKAGGGAMMETVPEAIELARELVKIGNSTGRRFTAMVTDMNEPLGSHIGNALEVFEAIEVLSGRVSGPLKRVSIELGAHMLKLSGVCGGLNEARDALSREIDSGRGLEKFAHMIRYMGGDERCVYEPARLPRARYSESVKSSRAGWVAAIRARDIGQASILLGAGREKKGDAIDPSVGLILKKRVGERVEAGEEIAELRFNSTSRADASRQFIQSAFAIKDEATAPGELFHAVIE